MQRRQFIDWVRGLAVVAMVVWHTADGWLVVAARTGHSWSWLRFVGGLAAPTFLFLAGTGAGLAARPERAPAPLMLALSRGLEVMLLGYLMRFQTWIIDAGAIVQPQLARGFVPLGLGYGLLYWSLQRTEQRDPRAGRMALLGALLCMVGFVQIPWLAPGRLARLLQVDVLQCIGASLVLLTLGERAVRLLQRPGALVALGVAVALVTELLLGVLPGPLPIPLAAYLGKLAAPAGQPAPTLFPLTPWLAYACFGAALGTLLRRREQDALIARAGLLGALLALASSEAHAYVQQLIALAPWSVHPLRVTFRVGLVLVLLLLGWLWAQGGRGRLLVTYGKASLRVYWAHLMVAYGLLGRPVSKSLALEGWALGVALLLLAMWALARVGTRGEVSRVAARAST